MKVSVVIPTFNEDKVISNCLVSLSKQTLKDMEIIVVDDGSSDKTVTLIKNFELQIKNFLVLEQKHSGPGAARNLGASKSRGEILVFVDADMEFEPDFIEKLIAPIVKRETIGTFSREEFLLNKENIWAKYWNINAGRTELRMIRDDEYQSGSPVFRAILKTKFDEAGGFDTKVGYTDDWSISRKLNLQATSAPGAKFYHRNPESLKEVWTQARWYGKNEFLTKNLLRRLYNLLRYNPLISLLRLSDPKYLIFTFVYNTAVSTSVFLSFFGENKNK